MNNNKENSLRSFFTGIYTWMIAGVSLSGISAYLSINTHYLDFVFSNPIFFYGAMGLELILMLGIQFLINKISPNVAGILFFIYAAITGIVSSILFKIYNLDSILIIFGTTIVIFITLALIGYTTKKDISGWGTFLFVGMIGVIVASLANIYFQNSLFDMVISAVTVLVFAGLTVYDNQLYKNIYNHIQDDQENIDRYTILGALHMYINFIAMFQNLLHLFGEQD